MSRIGARDVAFKCVFSYLFNKDIDLKEFIENSLEINLDEEDYMFVQNIFDGIKDKYDNLVQSISRNLKGYNLERIYKVDLAIILIATWEIITTSLPVGVIVNEAVDLAKKYSTDKSPTFINGVLASIIKEERWIQ